MIPQKRTRILFCEACTNLRHSCVSFRKNPTIITVPLEAYPHLITHGDTLHHHVCQTAVRRSPREFLASHVRVKDELLIVAVRLAKRGVRHGK